MADYLYGSAHVRALENAIIGRERIARLVDARTSEDAYAALAEFGVTLVREPETDKLLREETLLGILNKNYAIVEELAPRSEALLLWRYPYDCNNLKAAIKCFFRGIDPAPMLFDFGTVSAAQVAEMVKDRAFSAFPSAMCQAAALAMDSYSKTKNPQTVDLILDRACYADMSSAAAGCGNAFVQRLVSAKIDLTNLLMVVRILRMKMGEVGVHFLEEALLPGGALSTPLLKELFIKGEEALWANLRHGAYERFAEVVLASNASLTSIERIADDFWMTLIKETKFIPVGLEVMVAFLLAHEYEVRNIRIVLAGKEAGLDAPTIRERIRESYV